VQEATFSDDAGLQAIKERGLLWVTESCPWVDVPLPAAKTPGRATWRVRGTLGLNHGSARGV